MRKLCWMKHDEAVEAMVVSGDVLIGLVWTQGARLGEGFGSEVAG